jgi:hypothetical protein
MANTFGNVDILIMKISNSGNLIWGRPIGGNGVDYSTSIATDGSGNSSICGYYTSASINFSVTTLNSINGLTSFAARLDANGNVLWANTISGPPGANNPKAIAVAVDGNSNTYVTGYFISQLVAGTNTINSTGAGDLFVIKYTPSGAVTWVTTTGASGGLEIGNGIKTDPFNNVYVTGSINGSVCAIGSSTYNTNGGSDAFLAKFDNTGSFLWGWRIGSAGVDVGYNVAANASGVFLVNSVLSQSIALGTQTFSFTTTNDNMLLTQFNSAGSLLYATALDGGGDDVMDIVLDNCALYLGGDLQTSSVAFGSTVITHPSVEMPFIARLQIASGQPTVSISGNLSICPGSTTTLFANGASTYTWSNGAVSNSIVVSPPTNSVYIVTGNSPQYACPASKAQTVTLLPAPILTVMSTPTIVCPGKSATLSVIGALSYSWNSGAQTSTLVQSPSIPTVYSVTGYSGTCSDTKTTSVALHSIPVLTVSTSIIEICKGKSVVLSVIGANTYTWNTGSQLANYTVTPSGTYIYTVTGTSSLTSCSATAAIQVNINACASIESFEITHRPFSVFPNPAGEWLHVNSNQTCELVLTNVYGAEVARFLMPENVQISIDLSHFNSGIYFLRDTKYNFSQKVIFSN